MENFLEKHLASKRLTCSEKENSTPLGCSYRFHVFIDPRVKHGTQVGKVEDGQKAKNQVQTRHPESLQYKETTDCINKQY